MSIRANYLPVGRQGVFRGYFTCFLMALVIRCSAGELSFAFNLSFYPVILSNCLFFALLASSRDTSLSSCQAFLFMLGTQVDNVVHESYEHAATYKVTQDHRNKIAEESNPTDSINICSNMAGSP